MALCFLYETTALDGANVSHPILLTNGLGYNHPAADGFYEPRLQGATDTSSGIFVQRSVFDSGKLGLGTLTFGSVTAVNSDGGLSAYLNWGFGQTATLKLGDDSGPPSGFQTVLTAKASQVTASDATLAIGWADRTTELSLPCCPATFAGTNSGTAGLEGLATDIGGTNKPWALGVVPNFEPVQLNIPNRIFGWNFDIAGNRIASASVDKVKFTGSPWTLNDTAPGSTGGDYVTSADLLTALAGFSLTQGYYVTCLAESLVAMGGNNALNGNVTFDVTIEANAADRYAGSLWEAVILRAGAASGDVSAADVTALNAAAPYEAGYYVTGSTTFQNVADALAASVAACYNIDQLNAYRIRQMVSPSGTPVASFKRLTLGQVQGLNDGDLITVSPVSSGTDWTPVKTVRCTYGHNWKTLSASSIDGAVSATDIAFLTAEWRYTDPLNSGGIAAMYPNATSQDYTTYLKNAADAAAIAAVLAALYGPQRREYQVTVTFGTAFAGLLDLGAIVAVTHPKYGWSNTLAAIHGIRIRSNTGQADLKLWL